jgi:hypothetical protein
LFSITKSFSDNHSIALILSSIFFTSDFTTSLGYNHQSACIYSLPSIIEGLLSSHHLYLSRVCFSKYIAFFLASSNDFVQKKLPCIQLATFHLAYVSALLSPQLYLELHCLAVNHHSFLVVRFSSLISAYFSAVFLSNAT